MKVTCPISGITYTVATPVKGHAVSIHPMLSGLKVSDLATWYLKDWATGELTPEHTHLLGLALLQKLPIDTVAFPPLQIEELEVCCKVWHANMERLTRLAGKLERRDRKFRFLSQFRLGLDTIATLPAWLTDLHDQLSLSSEPISEKAKELNRASYKAVVETSASTVASLLEPEQVENMVVRALKNSPLSNSEGRALPVVLADWANKVSDFPGAVRTRWMKIIQVIFHQDYIGQILMSDIKLDQIRALEEHLRCNTPIEAVGTSHSSLLMLRIAAVIPVIEDFSPDIVTKRRVNAGNNGVIDALLGDSAGAGGRAGAIAHNLAKPTMSTEPKQTLAEKLAARMAGIAKKGGQ